MEIIEVKECTDELLQSINTLLPELSTSTIPITEVGLHNIVKNTSVHLLLARENGRVLGTLTLVVFPILAGKRAWIEDVVVSESARSLSENQDLLRARSFD